MDEYSLAFAAIDLATYAAEHKNSAKVGGNLGKVNTFTGVDVTNLTGGAFNAEDLATGNNAACFAYQAGALLAPDILSKYFADISVGEAAINAVIGKALAPLGCKTLSTIDKTQLEKYPGYRKSGGGS